MKPALIVFLLFIFFNLPAQIIENKKDDEEKIFTKIEIASGFRGGTYKWNEFVKKNFNFARIEKALPDSVKLFTDTARVQFVVDKNGIIKDIEFLSKNLPAFQQSCIEVYKNSPHWAPANQCGRAVNAYKRETFILQIDKTIIKRVVFVRS